MGYRSKVAEQERARELRAEAWALVEIANELGVSKSSVSLWVRDVEEAVYFWADLTEIPPSQFSKPYRAVADLSIRRSKHPMGCPSVRYACTRTHRAVMGLAHALLECPLAIPG
jgi:hypothetical protein